jgi:integrase
MQLPIVDENKQHKPTFSTEALNLILEKIDDGQLQALAVLLSASGMRIGEVLGLKIENVSEDGTTLTVIEKAYHGQIQDFFENGRCH